MMDEIFDRAYREGRADLNGTLASGLGGLGKLIGDSFKVLHKLEWSAPWEQKNKRARPN